MTEPANPGTSEPASTRCNRPRRAVLPMLAVALVGIGVGVFATKAVSHGAMWGGHHQFGAGFMRTGGMMGAIDPAEAEERAGRMARHLAVEVDATKEQTDKLAVIAKAAVKDLVPLRERIREARKQGIDLLGQPTVDRMAIEKLRAEQMANMESVSKRVAQALADAGEVLSPEQRKKLAERIEKARERHGWWRRG